MGTTSMPMPSYKFQSCKVYIRYTHFYHLNDQRMVELLFSTMAKYIETLPIYQYHWLAIHFDCSTHELAKWQSPNMALKTKKKVKLISCCKLYLYSLHIKKKTPRSWNNFIHFTRFSDWRKLGGNKVKYMKEIKMQICKISYGCNLSSHL